MNRASQTKAPSDPRDLRDSERANFPFLTAQRQLKMNTNLRSSLFAWKSVEKAALK